MNTGVQGWIKRGSKGVKKVIIRRPGHQGVRQGSLGVPGQPGVSQWSADGQPMVSQGSPGVI